MSLLVPVLEDAVAEIDNLRAAAPAPEGLTCGCQSPDGVVCRKHHKLALDLITREAARARPAVSDEALREMADDWFQRVATAIKDGNGYNDEMLAFARAVLASQREQG